MTKHTNKTKKPLKHATTKNFKKKSGAQRQRRGA